MTDRENTPPFSWATRWGQLARAVSLSGHEPVLVALSGGADSVFLLQVVARAVPRPKILAVHVDHGLRDTESRADAEFCARLCARLGVPFARREVELDGAAPGLEARAREARYRSLFEEAKGGGFRFILTGHHEDDALETLLMRWLRGSGLPGLAGLRAHNILTGKATGSEPKVTVVRPLLGMRREEVRRLLRDHEIGWREDSSNASPAHTRNRVREGLLPSIVETCGKEGLEGLRAFASAVESFEDELAGRTAHLSWSTPAHATASRSSRSANLGGQLERGALENLAAPLQRRALWRLIREGTGLAPSRALICLIQDDLVGHRTTRRALPRGWTLQLRRNQLSLIPPGGELHDAETDPRSASDSQTSSARRAERSPGPAGPVLSPSDSAGGGSASPQTAARRQAQPTPADGLRLGLPGSVPLPDGRSVHASLVEVANSAEMPTGRAVVELDARDLPRELLVRWARPGDRFHGLGAPGSRPVRRMLADAGVPREERGRVPLIFAGPELIWVAGVRPCERRRVRPGVTRRLRLWLEGAGEVELPSTGS